MAIRHVEHVFCEIRGHIHARGSLLRGNDSVGHALGAPKYIPPLKNWVENWGRVKKGQIAEHPAHRSVG